MNKGAAIIKTIKQIKYLFGRLLVAASAIKARAIIPIITS